MRVQMDVWVKTVQEECIVIIQPEALENLHVHHFIQDGYDYVCVHCGLLDTPLYAG